MKIWVHTFFDIRVSLFVLFFTLEFRKKNTPKTKHVVVLILSLQLLHPIYPQAEMMATKSSSPDGCKDYVDFCG